MLKMPRGKLHCTQQLTTPLMQQSYYYDGTLIYDVRIIGDTLIHILVGWGNLALQPLLELLVAGGANVNARDIWGTTPLFMLARAFTCDLYRTYYGEFFRCLLRDGADPHLLGGPPLLADAAKLRSEYKTIGNFDTSINALKEYYPEIIVDNDRDVFWDALEEIDGEGYGCSYDLETRWQEEIERSKRSVGSWQTLQAYHKNKWQSQPPTTWGCSNATQERKSTFSRKEAAQRLVI